MRRRRRRSICAPANINVGHSLLLWCLWMECLAKRRRMSWNKYHVVSLWNGKNHTLELWGLSTPESVLQVFVPLTGVFVGVALRSNWWAARSSGKMVQVPACIGLIGHKQPAAYHSFEPYGVSFSPFFTFFMRKTLPHHHSFTYLKKRTQIQLPRIAIQSNPLNRNSILIRPLVVVQLQPQSRPLVPLKGLNFPVGLPHS